MDDLIIELMTEETLGLMEKAVWTCMGCSDWSVREKLNHVELKMKKLLSLQCLREFGCVATGAWRAVTSRSRSENET